MNNFMTALGLVFLLASNANAAGMGKTNERPESMAGPVEAQNPVQVKASHVLTSKELARRGISEGTQITVSDFTAPGPRTNYVR